MPTQVFGCSVEVKIESPFLIGGLNPPAFGIDIAQIRNARGQVIIPDTHLKGLLRHAWRYCWEKELVAMEPEDVFGTAPDDVYDLDSRSVLVFHDLVATDLPELDNGSGPVVATFPRISVDEITGSVKEGHLLSGELVAPPGSKVDFRGSINIVSETIEDAQKIVEDLAVASEFIGAVGKFKTVGFGAIEHIGFGEVHASSPSLKDRSFEAGLYELSFGLSKPFLVDILRADRNTLSGGDTIPGSVIKGALARKLALDGYDTFDGEIAEVLESISFQQAVWSAPASDANSESPLSWDLDRVDRKDSTGEHLGLSWNPKSPFDYSNEGALPAFSPDWKRPWQSSEVAFDIRTRVGISESTGAAEEGQLFTQRLVCPHDKFGNDLIWNGAIFVPSKLFDDEKKSKGVQIVLAALAGGVHGIGKTNAAMISPSLLAKDRRRFSVAEQIAIRLDSPLLMVRAGHLRSYESYQAAVCTYWEHVFEGAANLASEADLEGSDDFRFFCELEYRHSYVARRYRIYDADGMEPFVLAKPGSVFVLSVQDKPKAEALLRNYLDGGLPAALWVDTDADELGELQDMYQGAWQDCPFLPENGFGHFTLSEVEK